MRILLFFLFLYVCCYPDLTGTPWIQVPYDDGTSYFHNRLTLKNIDCLHQI